MPFSSPTSCRCGLASLLSGSGARESSLPFLSSGLISAGGVSTSNLVSGQQWGFAQRLATLAGYDCGGLRESRVCRSPHATTGRKRIPRCWHCCGCDRLRRTAGHGASSCVRDRATLPLHARALHLRRAALCLKSTMPQRSQRAAEAGSMSSRLALDGQMVPLCTSTRSGTGNLRFKAHNAAGGEVNTKNPRVAFVFNLLVVLMVLPAFLATPPGRRRREDVTLFGACVERGVFCNGQKPPTPVSPRTFRNAFACRMACRNPTQNPTQNPTPNQAKPQKDSVPSLTRRPHVSEEKKKTHAHRHPSSVVVVVVTTPLSPTPMQKDNHQLNSKRQKGAPISAPYSAPTRKWAHSSCISLSRESLLYTLYTQCRTQQTPSRRVFFLFF